MQARCLKTVDRYMVSLTDLVHGIADHIGTPALARWWLGMSFAAGHFETVLFKRGVIHDAAIDSEPCVHEEAASHGRWKREGRMGRLLREAPDAVIFDPHGDALEYVVEPDEDGTRWRCFLEGLGFPKAVLAYYGDPTGSAPRPEPPEPSSASPRGRKPTYDWLSAYAYVVALAHHDGLTEQPGDDLRKADIVRALKRHFHPDSTPSESQLKDHAGRIYEAVTKYCSAE